MKLLLTTLLIASFTFAGKTQQLPSIDVTHTFKNKTKTLPYNVKLIQDVKSTISPLIQFMEKQKMKFQMFVKELLLVY